MAAYSAVLRGASRVFVVDRVPERLASAEKIGCTPIDFSKGDVVKAIIEKNGGMVDRSVDCVGYQATGKGEDEVPNTVIEQCIQVTRATGGLGIPGLYVPSDPGAPDEQSKNGNMTMSFGKLWEKVQASPNSRFVVQLKYSSLILAWQGLTLGTGQCNVKKYNRYLRELIISGRAKPSFVVSHEIPIDEAPEAYEKFDKRIDGYTKVLLHPNGSL